MRSYRGFDKVAICLAFDVAADFFALFEVGGDNDARLEFWGLGRVSQMTEHLYAGDGGNHQVEQDDIVVVSLSFIKAFLTVYFDIDLVSGFGECSDVELADKMFIFYAKYIFKCGGHDG